MTELATQDLLNAGGEILEKVMLQNDLSGLSPIEKVKHVKNMCLSMGLNPMTNPIRIMKFQGKEIPYADKNCAEQLRQKNKISIHKLEKEMLEGIYIVTAYARDREGREDSATGATTIQGLKGDALCNAMLKAETKAKRRVTLSICGLGLTDESEMDTMKGATPIPIKPIVNQVHPKQEIMGHHDNGQSTDNLLDDHILEIESCKTMDQLESVYVKHYKYFASLRNKEALTKIIQAKDLKKDELESAMVEEFNAELNKDEVNA